MLAHVSFRLYFATAVVFLAVAWGASCKSDQASQPSFLVVEFVAAAQASPAPGAVMVEIRKQATLVSRLCVNVTAAPSKTAASFLMRRESDQDPSERVDLMVTAYESLRGMEVVAPGKEFGCPDPPLPSLIGTVQSLSVDFCAGESRRVVFYVGAVCGCSGGHDAGLDGGSDAHEAGADTGADANSSGDGGTDAGSCGCADDEVCGAGLSSDGLSCGAGSCCKSRVSTACALEAVSP